MRAPRLSREGAAYARLRLLRNRAVIVRKRLRGVAPTSYVNATSQVAPDLVAADYVFVGPHCTLPPLVSIGRYTMLAPRVAVVGDDHRHDEPGVPMQFTGRPVQRATRIGADVWVGQGATVLRGLSVGDGAIVAAGAVVTRDVPAYEVWAGVPARKVRDRFPRDEDRRVHEAMLAGPVVPPRFVSPQLWASQDGTGVDAPRDQPGPDGGGRGPGGRGG